MFLLVLALCCRSTCQFRGNSEKSNHMLRATSHIELEFLTNFLNMSKLQNWLILLYQSLPLQIFSKIRTVPKTRKSFTQLLRKQLSSVQQDQKIIKEATLKSAKGFPLQKTPKKLCGKKFRKTHLMFLLNYFVNHMVPKNIRPLFSQNALFLLKFRFKNSKKEVP